MVLRRSAPAKINLGLHVLRKRADGFHDLETVFLRIPWADTVYVQAAPDISMTCDDAGLPTDASNLCLKAALRLKEAFEIDTGASIYLEKRIPYGAGLGGGSSDAASTLMLLVELWQLHISPAELSDIGAELGSDVPFFLGPPLALGIGRGTELSPLAHASTGEVYRLPYHIVVAVPDIHVATAEAYRSVIPDERGRPDLPSLVASGDTDRWRSELVNDFEPSVMASYPELRGIKESLYRAGANYASMSGSGAAFYAFFEYADAAQQAAQEQATRGFRTWHGMIED